MYLIPILPEEVQKSGPWTIYASCDQDGQCELKDFLENQPANFQSYTTGMLALMEHIAEIGPLNLPDSICHNVAEGIWELIKGRLRVLWFYDEGKVVICSHGFVKQSQKTPKAQIKTVQQFQDKYFLAKRSKQLIIKKGE